MVTELAGRLLIVADELVGAGRCPLAEAVSRATVAVTLLAAPLRTAGGSGGATASDGDVGPDSRGGDSHAALDAMG